MGYENFLPARLAILLVTFAIWQAFTAMASAADPVDSKNVEAVISANVDPQLGPPPHLTMMIVYATVALVFSFLCSVAEAVVLSISPSYIANLKNVGREKTAGLLNKIKINIDRSLAAILTLNTIAHTLGAGGEVAAYFGDRFVGIAMAVLTLLILFLSEIIPKTLGALYWRALAPVTGHFVQLLIWLLFPLILISELVTKWLACGKSHHQFNRDEFTTMVDMTTELGLAKLREVMSLGSDPHLMAGGQSRVIPSLLSPMPHGRNTIMRRP